MTYLNWACFHEGTSDALYLDVLVPRLMEDIVTREGVRHCVVPANPAVRLGTGGRAINEVAAEACAAREGFQIVFIHADVGGRPLERGLGRRADGYCTSMYERCAWPIRRCVTVTPRHETEAWILADPKAITAAVGFQGQHRDVGLPDGAEQAERLADPKAILASALRSIVGPRRQAYGIDRVFPAIAQRQDLSHLRRSRSFQMFEAKLKLCLADLGCIARPVD